jgi:PAS domain S-box-containing protein
LAGIQRNNEQSTELYHISNIPAMNTTTSQQESNKSSELMNTIHAIVWEADTATLQRTYVSTAAERMLGYPSKQWREEPGFWQNHIHPDERETTLEHCFAAIRIMKNFDIRYRFFKADGGLVWLRDIVTMMVDDGKPLTLNGVTVDITSEKQTVDELRSIEAHFRNALNTLADGITFQDKDSAIIFCNPRAEEILGLTADQMSGRTSFDPRWRAVHEDSSTFPGEAHPVIQTLRTGKAQRNVVMGIHKPDGTLTWIVINSEPILYDVLSQDSGVVASFTDITQQKQQEEWYRLLANNSLDLITLHTPEVGYTYLSPSIGTLLGYTPEELLGTSPYDIVHPDDKELMQLKIQNHVEQQLPIINVVCRLRHKDGSYRWVESNIKLILSPDTKGVLALQTAARDVTDQVQMQNALNALNQTLEQHVTERTRELVLINNEKSEFLGIAAHDLKNPLSGILSSADLLRRYIPNDIKANQLVTMIVNASNRMLDIITNLLDVNRIEQGLVSLNIQPVSLEILDDIVEEYRVNAAQKGIVIDYESPEQGTLWVLADKQAVQQILDNILSNAVKYSPQWKTIWVRVAKRMNADAHVIRVEVQDEGQGLSDEDKRRLFGKFARLSARPTGGENSTGLGLSIVKKLVELQHGRVWCESEMRQGATFIVELPSAEDAAT